MTDHKGPQVETASRLGSVTGWLWRQWEKHFGNRVELGLLAYLGQTLDQLPLWRLATQDVVVSDVFLNVDLANGDFERIWLRESQRMGNPMGPPFRLANGFAESVRLRLSLAKGCATISIHGLAFRIILNATSAWEPGTVPDACTLTSAGLRRFQNALTSLREHLRSHFGEHSPTTQRHRSWQERLLNVIFRYKPQVLVSISDCVLEIVPGPTFPELLEIRWNKLVTIPGDCGGQTSSRVAERRRHFGYGMELHGLEISRIAFGKTTGLLKVAKVEFETDMSLVKLDGSHAAGLVLDPLRAQMEQEAIRAESFSVAIRITGLFRLVAEHETWKRLRSWLLLAKLNVGLAMVQPLVVAEAGSSDSGGARLRRCLRLLGIVGGIDFKRRLFRAYLRAARPMWADMTAELLLQDKCVGTESPIDSLEQALAVLRQQLHDSTAEKTLKSLDSLLFWKAAGLPANIRPSERRYCAVLATCADYTLLYQATVLAFYEVAFAFRIGLSLAKGVQQKLARSAFERHSMRLERLYALSDTPDDRWTRVGNDILETDNTDLGFRRPWMTFHKFLLGLRKHIDIDTLQRAVVCRAVEFWTVKLTERLPPSLVARVIVCNHFLLAQKVFGRDFGNTAGLTAVLRGDPSLNRYVNYTEVFPIIREFFEAGGETMQWSRPLSTMVSQIRWSRKTPCRPGEELTGQAARSPPTWSLLRDTRPSESVQTGLLLRPKEVRSVRFRLQAEQAQLILTHGITVSLADLRLVSDVTWQWRLRGRLKDMSLGPCRPNGNMTKLIPSASLFFDVPQLVETITAQRQCGNDHCLTVNVAVQPLDGQVDTPEYELPLRLRQPLSAHVSVITADLVCASEESTRWLANTLTQLVVKFSHGLRLYNWNQEATQRSYYYASVRVPAIVRPGASSEGVVVSIQTGMKSETAHLRLTFNNAVESVIRQSPEGLRVTMNAIRDQLQSHWKIIY